MNVELLLQTEEGRRWFAQIEKMAEEFKLWLRKNPESTPIITFECPKHVLLITDLDTALSKGFIRLDTEGRRALDELGWTADVPMQPSFFMVKAAVEAATVP